MASGSTIHPVDHHEDVAVKHSPIAAKLGPQERDFELPPPATYSLAAAAERRKRIRASRRSSCGGVCCCLLSSLCGFLVAAIVILGIAALVIWLVLRPIKAPQYTVQDIQIQNFSLSPALGQNQQSTRLNSNISLTIQANNPNKKIGIIYDSITTSAFFDGNDLGSGVIPGFYQGHQNITTVTTNLTIVNYSLPVDAAGSLETDISNHDVPLEVRTSVKARVKIGSFKSFAFWVHVTCQLNINPPTSSNQSATVLNKSCKLTR